jgi:hypothetical protein
LTKGWKAPFSMKETGPTAPKSCATSMLLPAVIRG